MKSNFYTYEELEKIGLKSFGDNILVSRKCSIYAADKISIGNNVRIDDFCILSGKITLKNNIHIGAGSMLFAGDTGITLEDFSGLSSRCAVYAVTDDYSGLAMTNPTISDKYRKVIEKSITIGRHCVIGTGSTILPGANIAEGTSVGAMSLVMKPTKPWKIYFGIPARPIAEREKKILELEQEYLKELKEVNNA